MIRDASLWPPDEDRLQQRTCSVPHDLYPDTDKNERRQAKDNIHCSVSHDAPDWLGKAIHQVDLPAMTAHPKNATTGRIQSGLPRSASLAPTAIATEIEPGPTASGIVKG
jgi:hypothetical protein